MKLPDRKPSGREKDEAAVALLSQLRARLHSEEISTARKAAFNLSWMQEDGLEILLEALFGSFPRDTKKAAAYGLRSMNGRMRKLAEEALTKGLAHSNRTTKDACAKSLQLMKEGPAPRRPAFQRREQRPRRPGIREFRQRGPARNPMSPRNTRPER
ncbi:MAG: hypothetical protein MUC88_03230 [Planctomycetes bacterium]|jgi:hypothetical protein|nr:hypothetical protein [Planctomycetota bacterium]